MCKKLKDEKSMNFANKSNSANVITAGNALKYAAKYIEQQKRALDARGAGLGGHLRQQADKRFDSRVGERVVLRVALGLVVACGHRLRAPTHAEETLLPPRVLEGSDAVTTP